MEEFWDMAGRLNNQFDGDEKSISTPYWNETSEHVEIPLKDSSRTPYYVTGVDFWCFVQTHFPVEEGTRFSNPKFNDHEIEIEVCIGSTPPEYWTKDFQPDWLKQGN